jgi:hypothetical protein
MTWIVYTTSMYCAYYSMHESMLCHPTRQPPIRNCHGLSEGSFIQRIESSHHARRRYQEATEARKLIRDAVDSDIGVASVVLMEGLPTMLMKTRTKMQNVRDGMALVTLRMQESR